MMVSRLSLATQASTPDANRYFPTVLVKLVIFPLIAYLTVYILSHKYNSVKYIYSQEFGIIVGNLGQGQGIPHGPNQHNNPFRR